LVAIRLTVLAITKTTESTPNGELPVRHEHQELNRSDRKQTTERITAMNLTALNEDEVREAPQSFEDREATWLR
jgi:hypothetical protein